MTTQTPNDKKQLNTGITYIKSKRGIIRTASVTVSGLCALLSATDRFETQLSLTLTVDGSIDGPMPWTIATFFITFLITLATFFINFKDLPKEFPVPKTKLIISIQVIS